MDETQITTAFQLAAQETIPPMALGHVSEWWFRKGITAAETQSPPLEARITALKAQLASLVADIEAANKLLSKGDDTATLVQVRHMFMRATPSYLECVGRFALRQSSHAEPNESQVAATSAI